VTNLYLRESYYCVRYNYMRESCVIYRFVTPVSKGDFIILLEEGGREIVFILLLCLPSWFSGATAGKTGEGNTVRNVDSEEKNFAVDTTTWNMNYVNYVLRTQASCTVRALRMLRVHTMAAAAKNN
jgi:hypothetical protein